MSQSHAAILDDESDRGLRRVKRCPRGEDDNVTFVFSPLSPLLVIRTNPALLSKR